MKRRNDALEWTRVASMTIFRIIAKTAHEQKWQMIAPQDIYTKEKKLISTRRDEKKRGEI